MQGGLHAARIKRRGDGGGALATGRAIGKHQYRIAMHRPEAAQELKGRMGQRHEAIAVCARVGFDGLGLQALEFEVLEIDLVLPVKVGGR